VSCSYVKGTLASWLSGALVGLLPGVGSTEAGVLSSHIFRSRVKEFLMSMGGIDTANMFFTIIVFYSIGKSRSGATWALSEVTETITFNDMLLVMFTCMLVACVSSVVTLKLGKIILMKVNRIPYDKMTWFIIMFTIATVGLFTGWIGLLILFTGFFMGTFAVLLGINRTHLMGFLLFPTILFFSDMNVFMLNLLGM
jgi:TctA family transporter